MSRQLKIQFDYPEGWRLDEITKGVGRLLGEVQIFGPRRDDLKYSVYLDLAVEPLADGVELSGVVNRALVARQRQPSYRVAEQRPARCAGQPAIHVIGEYELTLPLEGVNAKRVPFQESVVYCVVGARLFRLSYAAPADDADRYRHAFTRFVKSFRVLP